MGVTGETSAPAGAPALSSSTLYGSLSRSGHGRRGVPEPLWSSHQSWGWARAGHSSRSPPQLSQTMSGPARGAEHLCTQREASRARSSVWRRPLTVSPVCPLATPSLSLLGAGVLSPWDWGVLAGAPRSRRPCCVSGAAPGSPKPRSPRAAPGCSGSQCPLVTAGTAAGKSHPRDRGAGGLVWGWGKTSHKGEELQLIQQDLRRAPAATLPWARTSHSRPGCSSPVGHPQLLQLLIAPPPTPARRFLLLSNLNAPSFS